MSLVLFFWEDVVVESLLSFLVLCEVNPSSIIFFFGFGLALVAVSLTFFFENEASFWEGNEVEVLNSFRLAGGEVDLKVTPVKSICLFFFGLSLSVVGPALSFDSFISITTGGTVTGALRTEVLSLMTTLDDSMSLLTFKIVDAESEGLFLSVVFAPEASLFLSVSSFSLETAFEEILEFSIFKSRFFRAINSPSSSVDSAFILLPDEIEISISSSEDFEISMELSISWTFWILFEISSTAVTGLELSVSFWFDVWRFSSTRFSVAFATGLEVSFSDCCNLFGSASSDVFPVL